MPEKLKKDVFIPGREVTKGKINKAISQNIENHFCYKFDMTQFMNQEFWREGEFDSVPGYWIEVHYEPGEPTRLVRANESAGTKEQSKVSQ